MIVSFFDKYDIDISNLTDAVEKKAYGGVECGVSGQFIKELVDIKKRVEKG